MKTGARGFQLKAAQRHTRGHSLMSRASWQMPPSPSYARSLPGPANRETRHAQHTQRPGWASWFHAECEEPSSKSHLRCGILIAYLTGQKCRQATQIHGCWGLGSRRKVAVTIKTCKRNRGMEFFWIQTVLGGHSNLHI